MGPSRESGDKRASGRPKKIEPKEQVGSLAGCKNKSDESTILLGGIDDDKTLSQIDSQTKDDIQFYAKEENREELNPVT